MTGPLPQRPAGQALSVPSPDGMGPSHDAPALGVPSSRGPNSSVLSCSTHVESRIVRRPNSKSLDGIQEGKSKKRASASASRFRQESLPAGLLDVAPRWRERSCFRDHWCPRDMSRYVSQHWWGQVVVLVSFRRSPPLALLVAEPPGVAGVRARPLR